MQDFINKCYYTLFIFTLTFGILLYDLIGFDYTDEICALALFTLFGFHILNTPEWSINKVFLYIICVFLFYLFYSLIINSNTKIGIISDFIIQIKPYLAMFCTYTLLPHFTNKQKDSLRLLSITYWIILLLLGITELFIPGVLVLVMGHSTYYAAAVIMTSFCFLYTSPFTWTNKIKFLLMLSIGLISGRSKFYGFYAFTTIMILYFSLHIQNFKINFKNITLITIVIAIVLFVAKEKISFYFFQTLTGEVDRDSLARFVLYETSPKILIDYFPFGSGFASFGTFASGEYYSEIYIKYGIEKVWGISNDFYSYVADTYYPSLAQFGIVGIFLYCTFWFYIITKGIKFYISTKKTKLLIFTILIVVFFVIEGVADSTFTTHRGFFMMMFLGLIFSDMKNEIPSLKSIND